MRFRNYFVAFFFILTSLTSYTVYGQSNILKEDVVQFPDNVRVLFKTTGKSTDLKIADDFLLAWNTSTVGAETKTKIMAIALTMQKKRFKVVPAYQRFFSCIALAVNDRQLSSIQLSKFLDVTERVLANYDIKSTLKYLETVRVFFEKQALCFSNYHTLYIRGGSYTFEFKEAPQPVADTVTTSLIDTTTTSSNDLLFGNLDQANPDDWKSWEYTESSTGDTTSTRSSLSTTDQVVNPLAMQDVQPVLDGPVIVFDQSDLTFVTRFDSVTLYQTKGSFLIKNDIWVGEGGKFDWAIAGMKDVFAKLGKYSFNVRRPQFQAMDVKLTYTDKLDKVVDGVFEFESRRHKGTDDAQFPRFKSYRNDISVKNIGKNILYQGGFTLAGNKIYSSSLGDGKALIQISYNGEIKLKAYSPQFELADSVIRSLRSSIVIYHQQDTISHPGVQFKFNKTKQELMLLKDEGNFKRTSYSTSYFKISFLADILKWNIQTDTLDVNILIGKSQASAWFESEEYYNESVFDNLTGLYRFHPLRIAVNYATKLGVSKFLIPDLASEYKLDVRQVRAAMQLLMEQGFADVDRTADEVSLRPRAFHYIKSKDGKKDYDNIIIPSVSPGKPNATIDLKKREVKIRGIERFYLSDSTNTYIEPFNKEIRIIKNRDFNFDGRINCGNFRFFGNNFRFDYDSFLVDMPRIDSIKFLVNSTERNKSGIFKKRQLSTQLELASGVLYINHPKNKSSRKKLPQYPIFDARTGATVFFNRKEILNKAYDKSLQFVIPPFQVDSLSASDPSTIAFNGTFKSNGLLPDFKERLEVLPDYILGFSHAAPPEGYPLYRTAARFYNYLTMDTKGLRGDGTISYLTTTLQSDSFVFYIDSVKATGTVAQMKEGEINKMSFPDAYVENYDMKWLPSKDSMYISNISNPIQLYKNTATLDGALNLTSKGVFGQGVLVTRGSEAKSEQYAFEKTKYSGNNAYFEIKSSVPDKPSFEGDSVQIQFDLVKNEAKISPEKKGNAALSFPYSQYKSSINEAKWLLNDKKIIMSNPASDISNSYFYSTRKDQDSLVFNASSGEYDITNSTLNIKGIPFIKVADAKIIPPKGEVVVLEDANIQPIQPAQLLIDTLHEYHQLADGFIEIASRTKFSGNAIYKFINAKSDTFNIKFDRFDFESYDLKMPDKKQTVAKGLIIEEDSFLIAPRIFYKGNVKMYATKKALELDGFAKLDFKKIPDYNEWIQYKRTDDVDQVLINFDNHTTESTKKLTAGIYIESGSNILYSTFASDKRAALDREVFQASGLLSYQFSSNEFRIATPSKYKGETYEGSTYIYNEDLNSMRFEGKLHFASAHPHVEVTAAGSGLVRTDTSIFRSTALMAIDFKFTTKGKGMEMMALDIKKALDTLNLPKAVGDFKGLLYNMANLIGDKAAKGYENQSLNNYVPLSSVSSRFLKTFVFGELDLKWSDEYKSWYSVGPLGLSTIDKYDINTKVNGYVEIRKGLGAEAITVLIEISPNVWYYFGYEEGRLIIFSSNDVFNKAVASKANSSVRPGEYGFFIGSMMDKLSFEQRFKAAYLGIYEKPMEEDAPQDNQTPVENNDQVPPLPDDSNKVPDGN